jgi:hypothetical protein
MTTHTTELNLVLAWVWMFLGFGSGMVLGLGFQREGWLGGYASHRRRLYRLGHISFFGLGAINLLFHLTARSLPAPCWAVEWASWMFVVGAVTMPLCCLVAAHRPGSRLLFTVPVLSLMTAAILTGGGIVSMSPSGADQTPTIESRASDPGKRNP